MNRSKIISAAGVLAKPTPLVTLLFVLAACGGAPAGPAESGPGSEGAAPGPQLAASSETLLRQWFPLVNTVFNDCNGEWVDIEGEFFVLVREVISSSGVTHFRVHVNVHVTGTGQSTGTGYVSNEGTNLVTNAGASSVFVLESRVSTVSKGSSDNEAGWTRIHMTVNANGDVTVDRFEFVFDVCRG